MYTTHMCMWFHALIRGGHGIEGSSVWMGTFRPHFAQFLVLNLNGHSDSGHPRTPLNRMFQPWGSIIGSKTSNILLYMTLFHFYVTSIMDLIHKQVLKYLILKYLYLGICEGERKRVYLRLFSILHVPMWSKCYYESKFNVANVKVVYMHLKIKWCR